MIVAQSCNFYNKPTTQCKTLIPAVSCEITYLQLNELQINRIFEEERSFCPVLIFPTFKVSSAVKAFWNRLGKPIEILVAQTLETCKAARTLLLLGLNNEVRVG